MYNPLLYRMTPLFALQRRASTDDTGRLFFPFFPNQATQLSLPIFQSPLHKLYSYKDRARLLRGRARI
jgi:hypothetical protein